MEFLWVRWFGLDQEESSGWNVKCLHRVGFVDGEDGAAFGFLDPQQVICGVHLIPAFHHGRGTNNLKASIARPLSDNDEDWVLYYIGMFADRDMVMRFRGGGVGHKSTREATDQFLEDRDPLNLDDSETSDMETGSDSEPKDSDEENSVGMGGEDIEDQDQNEWSDEDEEEEEDYGYGGLSSEKDSDESDGDSSDADSPDEQDQLGPEDGEGGEDDVETLGYSNL